MASTNKHGLSRYIPADIARQIRQRDGFGCVRCGSAIYIFEHVDPTFEEATEHDADAITLLCAGCHDLVTRGLLSKQTVKSLMLAPKCHEVGFSFGPFDVGDEWPTVHIGPVTLDRVPVVLRAAGDDLLRIEPPEEAGAPFRISAWLANKAGNETLTIVENEWRSAIGNWDVEVEGRRITIRDAPREIAVVLRTDPPHSLVIERLTMFHEGTRIEASASALECGSDGHVTFRAHAAHLSGGTVGIDIDADGDARMGAGGGDVFIGSMVVNPTGTPLPPPSLTPSLTPMLVPLPLLDLPQPPRSPQPGQTYQRVGPKTGRNDLCPCGGGRKFKRCCGGFGAGQ